ncbi:hypothetical protein ACFOQM_06530 [Paenibacillus sp. GCM10012307]|uniref:Uncharacterized protein n=1 Tax=Paenibacillus roseus TaxID=2798579 RepID=A0A934MNF4_9BACL|nr:hypothetical protein [Paenibacillus roseus]MBJ6360956.1 hypothetical protein [Paenibacillus roseus]
MLTYVCLGLLFLFVASRAAAYYFRSRRALSPEKLDQYILTILQTRERENK